MHDFVRNAMRTLFSRLVSALRGGEGSPRRAAARSAAEPATLTTELAAILCVMLGLDGRPTAAAAREHSRRRK
jgi:hypothetical protein